MTINKKLSKIQSFSLTKANQDIFITDILIRDMSYDINHDLYDDSLNDKTRLSTHLHSLFKFANRQHHANYCEKTLNHPYQIKKEAQNSITRLSTAEFSFYTKNPLKMHSFHLLIRDIERYAAKTESNVHLLLSSFAVLDEEQQLQNMTIYVECGKEPHLHLISKHSAHKNDKSYDTTLFSHQDMESNPTFHTAYIASSNTLISTNNVFEVMTQGGAKFTQAVDICMDHYVGHGKEILYLQINHDNPDLLIPNQIEQAVASNSVKIFPSNTISTHLLHIDPRYPINKKDINRNMVIKGDISIVGKYLVEILHERPAGKYFSALQNDIDLHNEMVLQRRITFFNSKKPSEEHLPNYKIAKPYQMSDSIEYMLNTIESALYSPLNTPEQQNFNNNMLGMAENYFDIPTKKLLAIIKRQSQHLHHLPLMLYVVKPHVRDYILEHALEDLVAHVTRFKYLRIIANFLNEEQFVHLSKILDTLTDLNLEESKLVDIIRFIEKAKPHQSLILNSTLLASQKENITPILSLRKDCIQIIDDIRTSHKKSDNLMNDYTLSLQASVLEIIGIDELRVVKELLEVVRNKFSQYTSWNKVIDFFSNVTINSYNQYDRMNRALDILHNIPVGERENNSKIVSFWLKEIDNFEVFDIKYLEVSQSIVRCYQLFHINEDEQSSFVNRLDNAIALYELDEIDSELNLIEYIYSHLQEIGQTNPELLKTAAHVKALYDKLPITSKSQVFINNSDNDIVAFQKAFNAFNEKSNSDKKNMEQDDAFKEPSNSL